MTQQPIEPSKLLHDGMHLIGGQFVGADMTLDVINPATGVAIATVPRGSEADVEDAVSAAEEAFPDWRDLNPTERSQLMWSWGERIREQARDIATLESMEVGKPFSQSYRSTVALARQLQYCAGLADKIHGSTLPTTKREVLAFTLREPYGVCAVISPWNVPGFLMMRSVSPALAAGNVVVVKPAEDAPLACLYLAKLGLEAGIPAGVVNIITGLGPEAGAILAGHPRIGHLSFTGSTETGTKVAQAAAENHVPVQLELGGKSPHVVLKDANLDRAIPSIVGNLVLNAGQICFAGTRLLVQEDLHHELVDSLSGAFRGIRVGAWNEEQVEMGPLINEKQEQRVLGYIEAGKDAGAKITTGGGKLTDGVHNNGYFVEPTILDEVKPDMAIAQEEIFGPVLSVIGFRDPDQALEIANGTPFGLTAAAWTSDMSVAVHLAKGLQAGQVFINTYGSGSAIGAPFGGYKHSGYGRTLGQDTVLEYTQLKTVIIDGKT